MISNLQKFCDKYGISYIKSSTVREHYIYVGELNWIEARGSISEKDYIRYSTETSRNIIIEDPTDRQILDVLKEVINMSYHMRIFIEHQLDMEDNMKNTLATLSDKFSPSQIKEWKERATHIPTKEEMLKKYDSLSSERPIKVGNRVELRSTLGSFANDQFNREFKLPKIGRRQQIGKAIQFGRSYLADNPTSSIYYALMEGIVRECQEYNSLVGNLTDKQKLSILKTEV